MRLFQNANFGFISNRKAGYILSGFMVVISLAAILLRGLQYGIDFRGGFELVVAFEEPVSVGDAREVLEEALGSQPQVRRFGSERELLIRTAYSDTETLAETVQKAFTQHAPDNSAQIIKTDVIGPSFAKDLQEAAILATIFSVGVISLYIFIRFKNVPFAVAVLVTLVHDVIIMLGMFTLFHGLLPFSMDIDQTLIAAFLTIIGYSLNDTIVVFDRIRENRNLRKVESWHQTINKSMNQTLSRTVVTSLTTFMVVVVLFLFGGTVLKGFSFALMAGIALGTYSTLFLACPLLADLPIKQAAGKHPVQTVAGKGVRG